MVARRKKDIPPPEFLPDDPIEGLTWKQRLFVYYYIQNDGNGTDAAERAGYAKPTIQAFENLRKPNIKAAIAAKVTSAALSADEVLARYAELASVNMGDFIGVTASGQPVLNIAKAKKAGKLHLIRKIKPGPNGTAIEVHDPYRALEKLGQYHRLFGAGDETAENQADGLEDPEAAKRAIQAANNGGSVVEPKATPDPSEPDPTQNV